MRIDYLSPTIYLTDLLTIAVLLLWLEEKWTEGKFKKIFFANSKKKAVFIIGFVFLLINCLWAKNRPAAFYKLAKICEFFFLGCYLVKEKITLKQISPVLTLAVVFSSLIGLGQFLRQSSLSGIFWWLGERTFSLTTPGIARAIWRDHYFLRPYATFSHPNSLAGFLLVGLLMIFPFLKKTKIFFPVLFLSLITLLLTFSRTVWFVGIIVFLISLFRILNEKKIAFKKLTILAGLFFFASLLLIFSCFKIMPLFFWEEESFLRRQNLIFSTLKIIRQSPFFGVGLNNYLPALANLIDQGGNVYWLQPVHNIFLLIAVETGLIGLLITAFLFKNFFGKRKNNYFLFLAFLVVLLTGTTDHYWLTLQQNQILLTLLIGLSLTSN